jgi:ADP-glucose pyrophosphorylase
VVSAAGRCSARNINVIEHDQSDDVILAGDHIYKMDYQPSVAAHRSRRPTTIAVRRPLADAT